MLKVKIISTELIKPSSPTPLCLYNFNLSLLDQLAPRVYIPLLLFYANYNTNHLLQTKSICRKLKKSLSETLALFYPLAGRLKENDTIDCNDKGVEFNLARASGQLSEFLKGCRVEDLNQLLPCDALCTRSGADMLLAIQVNEFDCGGVAIGLRLSHKIADGATLSSFITKWAAIASGANEAMDDVTLVPDCLFPPISLVRSNLLPIKENVMTKRLVFDVSAIATLQAMANTDHGSRPTRVEAVSALIWRCFMKAHQDVRPIAISKALHAVNLRGRMVPPVSDSYFSNLWAIAVTKGTKISECKDNMHGFLEKELRDAIREIDASFIEELKRPDGAMKAQELTKTVLENHLESGIHLCYFSSWCRFPFYDVDFSWGKPVWVSAYGIPIKNLAILLQTKGGDGMEVWVTLEPEEMAKFEKDQELLSFTAIA